MKRIVSGTDGIVDAAAIGNPNYQTVMPEHDGNLDVVIVGADGKELATAGEEEELTPAQEWNEIVRAKRDKAPFVHKYAGFIPGGSSMPIIEHNLGTMDVASVSVSRGPRHRGETGGTFFVDWWPTDADHIQLEFANVTHHEQYRIVISG